MRLGNDGLTDAERHASAERWRNGAGRTPSKDEMNRLRALTPVTPERDLGVTDEYFDYLAVLSHDVGSTVMSSSDI